MTERSDRQRSLAATQAGDVDRITLLLIEDDQAIQRMMQVALEDQGLRVVVASDGETALLEFSRHAVDAVLLDIRLPGMDGIEVCRELRRRSQAPIIGVTAEWSTADAVAGLEAGMDDYVLKPASAADLRRRLEDLLATRAGAGPEDGTVSWGALEVSLPAGPARVHGRELPLNRIEGHLLAILMARPGVLVHREELLERVWAIDAEVDPRLVDLHMRRLAGKLGGVPGVPPVTALAGIGYRLAW